MTLRKTYSDFLKADFGISFAEYLGIERPILEHQYHQNQWRYVRKSSTKGSVYGDWKPTRKEAKLSYKSKLSASKQKYLDKNHGK